MDNSVPLRPSPDFQPLHLLNMKPTRSLFAALLLTLAFSRSAHGQTLTPVTVDVGGGYRGSYSSQAVIGGNPAIAYYDYTNEDLIFARNSAADGSGTWTLKTVDSAGNTGQHTSLAVVGGNPAISYYDVANSDLPRASALPPEIVVEQPASTNAADGGSRSFGTVTLGSSASLVFTLKNSGPGSSFTITKDDTNAAAFSITASPVAPVAPGESTTFTVQFAPTNAGVKSAAIQVARNDRDENPFDLNLAGLALSFTNDADGDGSSDVAEFQLAASASTGQWRSPRS